MMPENYELWRERFAAALDPKFYRIEHVDAMVWYGRARLFANDLAAVLAEIKLYPTGASDVHFLVGAGDLDGLIELSADVESWGREAGCVGALIESRSGWAKVMKKHGYAPHQIAVRKDF